MKSLVQLLRFFAAVLFVNEYYVPLGVLTLVFGIMEALLSFWKEIAARVRQPDKPRYYDSPQAAHGGLPS